ncbi:hypothetical protein H4R18_001876 [Coemansia javaensis]|uniref:F-box domain-containing protein n=1 Tax=Coemansia javaensis TaxID=2761396 RepID=A0A9W8HFZ3_9FUNG|nr:hypothetical protein H4R18_001876 [Coemansia javaensis]
MELCDLPIDILRLVFRKAALDSSNVYQGYRANLPLVAVCKKWRDIALPIVHSRVYIKLAPAKPRCGEAQHAGGTPKDTGIVTNLDLIASAGCSKLEGDIARACSLLTDMMPGVRQIVFHKSKCPIYRSLYWNLMRHYGEQLWELGGRIVEPKNLRSLEMFDCPPNHSWAPFAADRDAGVIEFPKLRALEIVYLDVDELEDGEAQYQGGMGPWRLHFPKLEYLNLVCEQDTCPLLKHAVLPSHIDTISILVSVPVLLAMTDMRLPAANHIDMSINTEPDQCLAALGAASRIFEGTKGARTLELSVFCRQVPVPPEAISPLLTRLELHAPTGVDAALLIIKRLPSLVMLGFWRLVLDDIRSNISVPEPNGSCLVEPLNTRIETLWLHTSRGKQRQEACVVFIQYALLTIPSLKHVLAEGAPREPILDFIDTYLGWHPHLTDVVFDFGYEDDTC